MPDFDSILSVFLATIGSYEVNSVVIALAVTVAAWTLLFGYYFSAGPEQPRWKFGGAAQHFVLLWSWFWTAISLSALVGGIGFFAWRLSNGLMLVPTAPNAPDGVIFGYALLIAFVVLVVAWLPRLLLPAHVGVREPEPPVERAAAKEESLYQPLYPGLSFGEPNQGQYQSTTVEPPVPEPVADQKLQDELVEKPRRRRGWAYAAGFAVIVVAVVGAFGFLAAPSASTSASASISGVFERFALADFAATFRGYFADSTVEDTRDVIRDDSSRFQTVSVEPREGDFSSDIDRWRPLAKQGSSGAQYKLGVMYANGRGVTRDYVEAYKWLNIAAVHNNAKAVEGRDAVVRRMTPTQIERAQNLAREEFALINAEAAFSGEVPARLTAMTRRDLVVEGQKLLNARGFNVGIADGLSGRRTQAAVREFERQKGLPETGKITPEIVARLEAQGRAGSRPESKLGPTAILAPLLPSIPSAPVRQAPRVAPATECDRLAAHPSNSVGAAGVDFARIDSDRAIAACEQARARYPEELRFQYQLGRSLHKAERHSEALTLYSKAGEQGFALAQRSVGFMYANASGVAQDLAKAANWIHQAADRCDVDAQFALGTMYSKGQGVERNEAESRRWFQTAAAQVHPDARARLQDVAGFGGGASARDDRHNLTASDYTESRYIETLLLGHESDVVDAFLRQEYPIVLETLRPLAERGEASAQTLLGYMHRAGLGVERADSAAVEWYRKAAEQDDANAQYLLGYMHQRGFGVPQYSAQALQWYRKAAGQGIAAARLGLGVMYDDAQGVPRDHDEALTHFFSAAESGLAGAQHRLAVAYEKGDGVPSDFDEALKWYRLAAAQNFVRSQYALGEMYSQGKGVPKDPDEAMKWYTLASEQGLSEAQFSLAKAFAGGRGVDRDPAEALKLYTMAADQGHAEGQVNLAFAYLKGRGVERSDREAASWFRRAAAQCNADAQYQLATLYRSGRGVEKASAAEEAKLLKLAAEQGHADALQALGVRYAEGKGVPKNPSLAFKSIQKAAALGQPEAQLDLAETYARGSESVPQDYTKAAEWYRKAALQGDSEAQHALAGLYREGFGVARSNVEAVAWYRLAAAQGHIMAQHSLATAYRLGAGIDQDATEAARLYLQAAQAGDAKSQRDLGLLYDRGEGVLQDFVQARLWLGLATDNGDAEAVAALKRLANKLTSNQVAEAERLAKDRLPSDG